MTVYAFPADETGCGMYRLIWPAQELARRGHDIQVVSSAAEFLKAEIEGGHTNSWDGRMDGGRASVVHVPSDAEVVVLQRPMHRYLADAVRLMRDQGIAVVVEMDDDLESIHPRHPARAKFDPVRSPRYNWAEATRACDDATLVVVSTPALAERYGRVAPVVVVPNAVPDHLLQIPHVDSSTVGWGGAVVSHPDDPRVMGDALSRLFTTAGQQLTVVGPGPAETVAPEFGLKPSQVACTGAVPMADYAGAVAAHIGVGVAPLQHSVFNRSKSALKILEYSALGIPWVASGVDEYRAFYAASGGGLLAESPKAWFTHLRRLTRSSRLREELGAAGRAVVAERFTISKTAERWAEAWERARELERQRVGVL